MPAPLMLSGNLAGRPPVNSIGDEGNFFFDEYNGNVWGPKTGQGWPATPYTPNYPGGGGTPGGAYGDIQFNASGTFGGFVVGGDGTLDPLTGILTVTESNGVAFGSAAFESTTAFDAAGTATAAVSAFAATLGTLAYINDPLPINKGGTGTSTPSLVAGTNVTITGTWPNQTINASGGGGGSPGGSSGQYQYNDSGSFAGIGMILFADTTFYASASGSTGNTGLSVGSPWPLQYAFDQMAFVDANGYGVTIQAADGTYAAASAGSFCVCIQYRPRNALYFYVSGNSGTPANVILDGASSGAYGILIGYNYDTAAQEPIVVDDIRGFTVKDAYSMVTIFTYSQAYLTDMRSENNGRMYDISAYSNVSGGNSVVSGASDYIVNASQYSYVFIGGITFEPGSTNSTAVYNVSSSASVNVSSMNYTNLTGSGVNYNLQAFCLLATGGDLASIPGSAGTVDALAKAS
jgi:hypothetical protein